MEFGVRVLWAVFVLLASMCYPCEARANNRKDLRSTPDTTKADANNESSNASSEDAIYPIVLSNISNVPEGSEFLRIIINATENNTVIHVHTPYMENKKSFVETNKVIELKFTNSLTNTTARTTQGMSVLPVMSRTKNDQLNHYKTATIALAALCAVMLFTLVVTTMRTRSKSTSKKPQDTPLVVAKQPAESEYQSIRGLPRRETGNSYGYETVKPRLPPTRPSLAYLLQPNESEYENLKMQDLKTHVRESNPYVPMNEALAGSVLTGSVVTGLTGNDLTGSGLTGSGLTGSVEVLSGEDEDLYLTMKRLIRPKDTTIQMNDLGSF